MAAGSASASGNQSIGLSTYHGVGVYSGAAANTPKVADDFAPYGGWVASDCWVPGQYVTSQGDVWYHVYQEHYNGGKITYQYGYVYAPYVDNNQMLYSGQLIRCPWG
ncbi:hypothetical protein [Kitasatospora nipponensis]|uniref:hypothetical protein n=1 Tax=Kitasatospora nipponensis TaxID=258049 RepID=UPI0031D44E0C